MREVLVSMAVSSVSVATTVLLLGALVAAAWFYFVAHFKEASRSLDEARGQPPSPTLLFQLHEAVVMRQLILPGDISTTWGDIGGCDGALRHIREQVIYPLTYACSHKPEPLLMPPKGVLLHGPPGCGKTLIAKAIAKEVQAHFLNIDVSTIKSKWVGETEKMAAAIFSVAYKIQPCIIFLDEVDTLLGTREGNEGPANLGLKAVFLQMWDGLESNSTARILVLAATNRLHDVDPAFLRRLPLQFEIGLPSAEARHTILGIQLQHVPLGEDVDLEVIVRMTDGFSGSDLHELCRSAATRRLAEYMDQLSERRDSQPSVLRPLIHEDLILALELHRLHAEDASIPGFYK